MNDISDLRNLLGSLAPATPISIKVDGKEFGGEFKYSGDASGVTLELVSAKPKKKAKPQDE